ncbi:hypothetical protein [Crassaminicella profunda]|uniref:hypothetical protein n=1 Tax=Crassaminicella profunda TaxID=1286698 RepID=UPI001CA7144C|nr:hypothetical protein [Crassaminicella profunda]QZY56715.1 hypothetical protein K7H06_07280 [Crassaminicella profunda]
MSSFNRMRERQSKQNTYNTSEMATVTSSDNGQGINANGVGEYREIPLVAPFGIRWNPPSGQSVELIKNWSNGKSIVAVGTIIDKSLEPGESELYSIGGASVKCKNDGSINIISGIGSIINLSSNGSITIQNHDGKAAIALSGDGNIKIIAKKITHTETE